jgi:hypothetical protein
MGSTKLLSPLTIFIGTRVGGLGRHIRTLDGDTRVSFFKVNSTIGGQCSRFRPPGQASADFAPLDHVGIDLVVPTCRDGPEDNLLPSVPAHIPLWVREILRLGTSGLFCTLGLVGSRGVRLLLHANREHLASRHPQDLHQQCSLLAHQQRCPHSHRRYTLHHSASNAVDLAGTNLAEGRVIGCLRPGSSVSVVPLPVGKTCSPTPTSSGPACFL